MSFRFTLVLLSLFGIFTVQSLFSQVLQTYNTGANSSWVVPAGVTYIKVETWGAGGRGGSRTATGSGGGGGGGGAFASKIITVIPGQTYYVRVGTGSSNSSPGGDSWFTTTSGSATGALVLAKGGSSVADDITNGANGGSYATCIGELRNNGGNGANGVATAGGGGGSSAGSAGMGINATNQFGAVGPTGLDGVGGNGLTGNAAGLPGVAPGGGGGGARRTNGGTRAGGNGANGRLIITDLTSSAFDLSINKSVDNTTPLVGTTVTFTIVVENYGSQSATGLNVEDILPNGFTYVSHTASNATTYSPITGIWNIGTLNSTRVRTLTITATVNSSGSYANTATLTASKENRGISSGTITLFPQKITTNLNLTKEVDNTMPLIGDNVVFTLTAHNAGPQNATGVKVEDILSFGYTHVSNSGNYNAVTGVWNIGTLSSGATVTLTLTAKVNPSGNRYNQALISGNELDPDLSNNLSVVVIYPMYPLIEIVLPCAATSYDLTDFVIMTPPVGSDVSWHTATPADASNKIAIPSNVKSGQKYYVAFYDPVADCFGSTSEVNIKRSCLVTNPMIRQKVKK